MKPIIPWMGGKRRLADEVLAHFPPHKCYVEPFCGAAALYFAKPPGEIEILNDINGDLVNLYRVIQYHLEEFVRTFKWCLISREEFERQLKTRPASLTDIQRAARFFYLQKLSFGAKVTGRSFGVSKTSRPRLNLLRIEEDLSGAYLRLCGTVIENLRWSVCVEKYDSSETLFYLDPPYYDTAGYGVAFGVEQYHQLAKAMHEIKGQAILSINDHPEIREIFKAFPFTEVKIDYTVGGAGKGARAGELIYRNRNWQTRMPVVKETLW